LWRKGGILFGPRSGGRELDINRKLSKSVWQWVFSDFLERRAVVCIEPQEGFVGWSTAKARKFLETVVGQETMKRNVFTLLVPESAIGESGSDEAAKAFRNLQNVFIESFDRKDIRSLVKSDMILFFKNDESLFEEMVVKHGTN
jgi:ribosomal protein L4